MIVASRLSCRISCLCLLAALPACSRQAPVRAASASGQGAYALHYVDEVAASRGEATTSMTQIENTRTEFQKYPDALSSPSWPDVLALYRSAEESGRTAAYVDELERSEIVARYYFEEKEELNRRVGGSVQHAAKEKQCDVDLYGTASYALGKGVEETLRDRLRERSEANRYVEQHEEALGKRNRPALETQVDAIARGSYLVYVALPKLRERLARQVDDASGVESTLERVASEENARGANEKAPSAVRRAAAEREQAANAARQKLAPEVTQAKKLRDDLEKATKDAQQKYAAAFRVLTDAVTARASAKK